MSVHPLVAAWLLAAASCALAAPPDCRECHSGSGAPGEARDFSVYYVQASRHHPAGVAYPADDRYRLPDARDADGPFFDGDKDGRADADEVRLFGSGPATVECGSCHYEHGEGAPPAAGAAAPYLRGDLAESRLCTACHRN